MLFMGQFLVPFIKRKMAVSSGVSAVLSFGFALMVMALMQVFRSYLASNKMMTIAGGFIGSIFFTFLLTAVNNAEQVLFGKGFQAQLPEVVFTMVVSCMVSASIHRVCITTCIIFSLLALYFINTISQRLYAAPVATPSTTSKNRKKK